MSIEIQDLSLLPEDCCIFFCWQDHLDRKLHRFLIRDALNAAIAKMQTELPDKADCSLRQDSDTSNRSGSVDIADTILEKIAASTVVVADVTPVLVDGPGGRFYPNPNVMIELGYAARAIGWDRVICVYNAVNVRPENLPFDIRQRRVTPYRCASLSDKPTAAKELEGKLVASLRVVLQDIGRGAIDRSLGDEKLKHQRDLRLLRDLMRTIHRPTMNQIIERGQVNRLHYDGLFFWEGLDAIVRSCQFRFYDRTLERLARELHATWGAGVDLGASVLGPGKRPDSFVPLPEPLWDQSYSLKVRQMAQAFTSLFKVLGTFLDHVHLHYPEIDMNETDALAWKDNEPYIEGRHFRNPSPTKASAARRQKIVTKVTRRLVRKLTAP